MRKYLKFIVLCGLAALLLWWFGRGLDWAGVSASISRADWRLIAVAVVLIWLTYLIRALRWCAFLKPLAPDASLRETFAATTMGFSAIFLAGRGVGEVLRPAVLPLRDKNVRPSAAFVTIAVERLYDMTAVIVLFALNLLFLELPGADEATYGRIRTAGLVLLAGAGLGIAALIWLRRHADAAVGWLEARLVRWPKPLARAGKILASVVTQLARTLGVLVDARELLVTAGWTAALWAAITAANLLVLRAFGLPLGVSATVFVLGWSLVGSLLPTPGGAAGTYHAATAYGMTAYLGVPETEAKSATIVLHLVVFGASLFFGVYYFLRSDVSLARLRELMAEERAEAEREIRGGQGALAEDAGKGASLRETRAFEASAREAS